MAKVSKASVDYKLGGPHCHACKFFIEDNTQDATSGTCQKVAGAIGEHMVCDLFQRDTTTMADSTVFAMKAAAANFRGNE